MITRMISTVMMVLMMGLSCVGLTGCDRPVVHQKSVSQLNQKAAELMQEGDTAGAVARLEAAHDLVPDDGLVQYNLGIAYQGNDEPDKAIKTLTAFVQSHPNDSQARSAVQSIAVIYEQVADQWYEKSAQEETESGEKVTSAQQKEANEKATEAMKQAIVHYEHLLKLGGISPDSHKAIQHHVKQLNEAMEKQNQKAA